MDRGRAVTLSFRALEDAGVPYQILHSWQELPLTVSGDVDFVVPDKDLPRLAHIWRDTLPGNGISMVQAFPNGPASVSYLLSYEDGLHLNSFLRLDACSAYVQRWCCVLEQSDMLQPGPTHNGLRVAAPIVEFSYVFAKSLFKEDLQSPARAPRLRQLMAADREACGMRMAELTTASLARLVEELLSDPGAPVDLAVMRRCRRTVVLNGYLRSPSRTVALAFRDLARMVKRARTPTGLAVAVLGPDGVGKSTLVQRVAPEIHEAFSRTMALHHRPHVLPSRRGDSMASKPHGTRQYGVTAATAKTAYLLADYWLGFLLRIWPCLVRGGLVVLDRCSADMTIDPTRYGYRRAPWLAQVLTRIVPRPQIYLVLSDSLEALVARSDEVESAEVAKLASAYACFADETPGAVSIDASSGPTAAARAARKAILDFMANRELRRARA